MAKTILIIAANPKNTQPLRLDQEVREIDNGLERAKKRDEFILKQKLVARPEDIRRAMLDYKPNIVHFCGHGSGEAGIAFEDEIGQEKLVSTAALTGLFELFADKVECVVINACYSEVQAEAIAKYIPYVIGMKKNIGDIAAIAFAVAFYDALGAEESIEFAYKLGCNAIRWNNLPENLIPVIKKNSSASKKIKPKDKEIPPLFFSSSINQSSSKEGLIDNHSSQLRAELKKLNEIEEALVNDKDTISADENLRQWKRRVTNIINQDDLYNIHPDDNQKTPYNQTRNIIKKCRIFIEKLLNIS